MYKLRVYTLVKFTALPEVCVVCKIFLIQTLSLMKNSQYSEALLMKRPKGLCKRCILLVSVLFVYTGLMGQTGNTRYTNGSFPNITTGDYNTAIGDAAGYFNSSGRRNTFSGAAAGYNNTTGQRNTFSGAAAGYNNTTGENNTFSGVYAGYYNTTGYSNTFSGSWAGLRNTTGSYNAFSGSYAGYRNTTGQRNTFSGSYAGYANTTGHGNVFIGYQAGYHETGSDKLYVSNSSTGSPLIYGDFQAQRLTFHGNVGIGTTDPGNYQLAVEGKIGAREVEVTLNSWSDFVFEDDYKLRSLKEVENYIRENNHLPDIPSEAEVLENGISLGEMNAKLLQKIEELTLYVIQQQKEIEALKAKH